MSKFNFHFSLSVLNHLGRGLYRSLATVIAEAISNAWDADATEVRVELSKSKKSLVIWDNGVGMDDDDFQNKFLKIGYSRRALDGTGTTPKGRKPLGRKGIGKLAYLSVSEDIIVHTQKQGCKPIGAKISNSQIDKHIRDGHDTEKDGYNLGSVDFDDGGVIEESGTRIVFDKLRSNLVMKNMRQTLATQFHFANALKGTDAFSIHVDGEPIGVRDLHDLYKGIQFIWFIDQGSEDKFNAIVKKAGFSMDNIKNRETLDDKFAKEFNAHGFIASVDKPRKLLITGSRKEFRTGVALFAGGRIRQANLLSDIPSPDIPETYLFGQIHADDMDEGAVDRFPSSRDSVMENDPFYVKFSDALQVEIRKIMSAWDKLRLDNKEEGDPGNTRKSPFERKVIDMFNLRIKSNQLPLRNNPTAHKAVDALTKIAAHNTESYVDCFIAENMARSLIFNVPISLPDEIKQGARDRVEQEKERMKEANVHFPIAQSFFGEQPEVDHLGLHSMVKIIDQWAKQQGSSGQLNLDFAQHRIIRNALMHGRYLTPAAKGVGHAAWLNITLKVLDLMKEQNGGKK